MGLFNKITANIKAKQEAQKAAIENQINEICSEEKERALVDVLQSGKLRNHGVLWDDELAMLRNTSAQIVLCPYDKEYLIVLSEKIVYIVHNNCCYKDLIVNSRIMDISFFTLAILESSTTKKKSSVVGSAVAGGIVAGGVGAVVGAGAALSNNMNGGKTVTTHHFKGKYGMRFTTPWFDKNYDQETISAAKSMWIERIYLSDALINRFGSPSFEVFENEKSGFVKSTTCFVSKEHSDACVEFLLNAKNTFRTA